MKILHSISSLVFTVAFALIAAAGANAASYIEATNGDLSGDHFHPTVFALDAGSNALQGNFNGNDLDYVTVIVPSGYVINKLILNSLITGGANSFLGVQAGSEITMAPTSTDPSLLLGWNHIFANQQGLNLLPGLGIAGNLAAGSYSFWINETSANEVYSYGFDFQVAAVPEPAESAMLMLGLCLIAARIRRRQAASRVNA